MGKSSSTGILLWEGDLAWHLPLPSLRLYTSPGINYMDPLEPPASDFLVRWALDWIDHEGRKGGVAQSKEAWTKYLAEPVPKYSSTLAPYNIVITYSHNPISLAPPSGNTSSPLRARARQGVSGFTSTSVLTQRKGRSFTLRPRGGKVSLPKPVAKPKYSTNPLPQFKLAQSAMPPGTPQDILDSASGAFSASVSLTSQASYKTALGHLERAEAVLGEKFSSPPTEQQLVFFTAYLAKRGVTSATIKSYLSAVRYISLSRGASRHTKLPELGAQIVAGVCNMRKDAMVEAIRPKRRPITVHMLVLLRHAIAGNQAWNDLEKCLRWSCMLTAFWGSFRMSELIQSEKAKFNSSTALLPADIKFHEESVAIWVRSPKVWREGGDVVEVWEVKENEDLDPVLALKQYLKLRSQALGPAEDCPVFLHQDGSQFTKAEMNKDIKQLLGQYPSIASPRDMFSGHSFRAGISTLLTSLGFTEEQIKNWGRWSSSAFLAYVQDQSKRRDTRKQFTEVFGLMLAEL